MAMKDYSDEFKADAVALYELTPGRCARASPLNWVLPVGRCARGSWRSTSGAGVDVAFAPGAQRPQRACVPHSASTPEAERIREFEARIRALQASERKLATERDVGLFRPCEGRRVTGWQGRCPENAARSARGVIEAASLVLL
jgi:hypothetical protein